MMSAPEQFEFDYLVGHYCPFLTLEESGCVLAVGVDAIEGMIDDGTLRAIDIKSPGSEKRSLRVFRYTVLHRAIRPEQPLTHLQLTDILTHGRPTWLPGEVAKFLRCTEPHINNLWDDKACPITGPNSNAGRSSARGKARRINRASLLEFLIHTTVS